MRGVKITYGNESIHTGNDLGLVQEIKKIGKPEIQTDTVAVPGRNGLLNLTKSLTGKVCYYNRQIELQYFGNGSRANLLELDSRFSKYHGQTIRIIDDDYPDFYFEGEVVVNTIIYPNYITIILVIDAQPYRLKNALTEVSTKVTSQGNVTVTNLFMPTIPTITVSASMSITFGSKKVTLSAGTYTIDEFELSAGNNTFLVSGSGTITFKYQEGAI